MALALVEDPKFDDWLVIVSEKPPLVISLALSVRNVQLEVSEKFPQG